MSSAKKARDGFSIFRGLGKPAKAESISIPRAPPWRRFGEKREHHFGRTFVANDNVKMVVNAALHLRRPILITGDPGTGKSSVAYAVAEELGLNPVLKWPINSRSTLKEGLYHYDAIARLQDAQHDRHNGASGEAANERPRPIGDYITLGPLGTAMVTSEPGRPRVLLVDEIDKSDIDLPNDLLHAFEDGYFDIPELLRLPQNQRQSVDVFIEKEIDEARKRTVEDGTVSCKEFPFVVLTSNGERELPPAFHRRCLRLDLRLPEDDEELHRFLVEVVERHLADYRTELHGVDELVEEFRKMQREEERTLAVDQLLQAVFLMRKGVRPSSNEIASLRRLLLMDLRQ